MGHFGALCQFLLGDPASSRVFDAVDVRPVAPGFLAWIPAMPSTLRTPTRSRHITKDAPAVDRTTSGYSWSPHSRRISTMVRRPGAAPANVTPRQRRSTPASTLSRRSRPVATRATTGSSAARSGATPAVSIAESGDAPGGIDDVKLAPAK